MDHFPLVSITIVNYRDYVTTSECLESIQHTTYPNYEVIVIDNESDNEQLTDLKNKFKRFRFVDSHENLYYAGGNNLGIENSRGEIIVLLNNDTKVTPGWLEPIVAITEREPMAFYQPQILFMDNPDTINSMGNTMNVFGFSFPLEIGNKAILSDEQIREAFYCSGACLVTTRKAIDVIGMLDSNFYNYYEDVNWGWRGRLLGIKSFVIPSSIIYHKWGGSYTNKLSARKLFYLERGRMASILRNFSARSLIILIPPLLLIDLAISLYCLKAGMIKEKLAAGADVWKNLRMIMDERKRIQASRKVDDAEIVKAMSRKIRHPYLESSPAAKKMLDTLSGVCMKMLL